MKDLPTKCVHSGTIHDDKEKGVNSPIYTSTSYEFIDQDETIYPRYLNTPNERAVAKKIADLEGVSGLPDRIYRLLDKVRAGR